MKALLVIMLAVCATACVERNEGARISVPGEPELRFAGGFNAQIGSPDKTVHVTYRGRTIRLADGALYVDGEAVALPAGARVVKFDGPNIYVDGRNIDSR